MISDVYQKIKTLLESYNFIFYWRNETDEPPTLIQNKIYYSLRLSDINFIDLLNKKQISETVFDVVLFCSYRNEMEYLNNLQTISNFFETFDQNPNITNNLILMLNTLNINYIEHEYRFEINFKIKGR